MAIIAVLASMLLPALSLAKEKGRRALCISNLRQTVVAIYGYAADSEGRLPASRGSDVYMQCKYWAASTNWSYGSPAPTALGLLVDDGHLPADLLRCPSRDQSAVTTQSFQGRSFFVDTSGQIGRKFDYDYRYNQPHQANLARPYVYGNWADYGAAALGQAGGYPATAQLPVVEGPVLDRVSYGEIMLLSDCCEGANYHVSNPSGDLVAGLPTPIVWAHQDGGHIAQHDGAVRWLRNYVDTSGATTHRRSWPCDWIINQSRYYELSLDPVLAGQ